MKHIRILALMAGLSLMACVDGENYTPEERPYNLLEQVRQETGGEVTVYYRSGYPDLITTVEFTSDGKCLVTRSRLGIATGKNLDRTPVLCFVRQAPSENPNFRKFKGQWILQVDIDFPPGRAKGPWDAVAFQLTDGELVVLTLERDGFDHAGGFTTVRD